MPAPYKLVSEMDLQHKRVLIRQDLNVPLSNGKIVSSRRIEAALPTIRLSVAAGAKVMLMSHLGRPAEGRHDAKLSLAPVAKFLSDALQQEVKLCTDYLTAPPQLAAGEVAVLENVRFNIGEKANAPELAKQYAGLCDAFVMDAFGAAHRSQASTEGVARHAPLACAGLLLMAELAALEKALTSPQRPLVAIIGGAKVSSKLSALETLSKWVDCLILGGGIANTFLAAAGHRIGNSLYEPNLVATARELLEAAAAEQRPIPLPQDVVVAKTLASSATATVKPIAEIADDDMIFDIGPSTVEQYVKIIKQAGTVVWNGPLGMFEYAQFSYATETLGRAVANAKAFSVAGGGDTLAATEQFNLTEKLSCISTGGGALLEFMEGKTLPALAALESRAG